MLTHIQVLVRSLKISSSLLFIDILITFLLRDFIYPFETFGDMLLVEIALLFLIAGFSDFGTSLAFAEFRKLVFGYKEAYSLQRRKDAERRALAFVGSGVTLLIILIILAAFKI